MEWNINNTCLHDGSGSGGRAAWRSLDVVQSDLCLDEIFSAEVWEVNQESLELK